MKIRNGFVSNSSSSSFVIVGTTFKKTMENCEKICKEHLTLSKEDIEDYTEKMCCNKKLVNKFCPSCGKKNEDVEPKINWISIFNNNCFYFKGINIYDNDGELIVGKNLSIDLESCSMDVDKLIKELQDAKKEVEKLNIGDIKFHCGINNDY